MCVDRSEVSVSCSLFGVGHDERIVPLTVLPLSTSTLTEQSNSQDVSVCMPRRAWQDVSVVIGASPRARGQCWRCMNSPVMLDAVPVQHKPLLFHGKVLMYPVLQIFVISPSDVLGGDIKIRNKLRRGAWLVEHLFSVRPSVIRHWRLSYASLLDPADKIPDKVSSRIQAFMASTRSLL